MDPTLPVSMGHSHIDGAQEGWIMEDVCRLQGVKFPDDPGRLPDAQD